MAVFLYHFWGDESLIELKQGDCLELMKDIPDNSVDMILCDLPYGTTSNKWDNAIPFELLWKQYNRICKENAAIVLFSQMPFSVDCVNSNRKQFRYEWIWVKPKGTGFLNAKKMPLKAHENILVFYKKLPTYNPQFAAGKPYYRALHNSSSSNYREMQPHATINHSGKRFPIDVLKFTSVNCSSEKNLHPTQKPVDLLEYLIKTYTNESETVLDNCMGSGSTGVACVNTNRSFIGIELNRHYFDIAKSRIEGAHTALTNQGGIFMYEKR